MATGIARGYRGPPAADDCVPPARLRDTDFPGESFGSRSGTGEPLRQALKLGRVAGLDQHHVAAPKLTAEEFLGL